MNAAQFQVNLENGFNMDNCLKIIHDYNKTDKTNNCMQDYNLEPKHCKTKSQFKMMQIESPVNIIKHPKPNAHATLTQMKVRARIEKLGKIGNKAIIYCTPTCIIGKIREEMS